MIRLWKWCWTPKAPSLDTTTEVVLKLTPQEADLVIAQLDKSIQLLRGRGYWDNEEKIRAIIARIQMTDVYLKHAGII